MGWRQRSGLKAMLCLENPAEAETSNAGIRRGPAEALSGERPVQLENCDGSGAFGAGDIAVVGQGKTGFRRNFDDDRVGSVGGG